MFLDGQLHFHLRSVPSYIKSSSTISITQWVRCGYGYIFSQLVALKRPFCVLSWLRATLKLVTLEFEHPRRAEWLVHHHDTSTFD